LAEEGFTVTEQLTYHLGLAQYRLQAEEMPHFYPGGEPVKPGSVLKQKELAQTLRLIQEEGLDVFYEGQVAEKLAAWIQGLERADFAGYSVERREPVRGKFGEYEVLSAPAPFSGLILIQSLQMAELAGIDEFNPNAPAYIDLLSQIFALSYAERLTNIADPRFVEVPQEELASMEYACELVAELFGEKSDGTERLTADPELVKHDDGNTTHFVIIDQQGMMVSATHTVSQFFGSGVYVDGFFLNNQLRNFAENPQSINAMAPGKKPRSFIAPTILAKDGKPVLGIGTPGGKWIPMKMAQVLIDHLQFGTPLQEAIEKPRFYIFDNIIYFEEDIDGTVKEALRQKGYSVLVYDSPIATSTQAMAVDYERDLLYGGSELHRDGTWKAEMQRTGSK
jgi:gamma-glutamyltranspeptidase/glutathione hydrolase